jgi:hypothetical protein
MVKFTVEQITKFIERRPVAVSLKGYFAAVGM